MSEEQLQYPPFDEETGKVICQICGKQYLVISPRHLMKHDVAYADYTKRYPTAPLSSKEFSAKSKYGKVKDLFTPVTPSDDELEEVMVHEQPTIEDDAAIEKMLIEKSQKDPVKQSKAQVLDNLRFYFTNIRENYLIEEYGPMSGKLLHYFMTDFADPILKVVVQFPNTFWHNRDIDQLKNEKLRSVGWKVLVVKGKAPSRQDIETVVDQM